MDTKKPIERREGNVRVLEYPCGCVRLASREVCKVQFERQLPKCQVYAAAAVDPANEAWEAWSSFLREHLPRDAADTAQQAPRFPRCNLCFGPHPFDISIDNETWNRVIRRGGREHDREFLCLCCIVQQFMEAGEGFEATLHKQGVNGMRIIVKVESA